ncbi:hypothetical protein [Amycolatopsis speibonae]|uniref:Uncharacterized protein n=1 Tax=Amycolatopsis speibonae TaxID=1450224 RepID=A0ABV7PB31_9PSEU
MSTRIDIRRTAGGLRLLIPACGAPRQSIRLSYAQADDLITAIRSSQIRHVDEAGNTMALSPLRSWGTDESVQAGGTAWTALLDACYWLHLRDPDVTALGDALSAHMPDRMTPLPEPRLQTEHPADSTRT